MTLYLVKHGSNDWRLQTADGTVIGSGQERPSTRTQVDWLADYHNAASILGDPTARKQFADLVAGGVNFRDNTRDSTSLPWE